MAGSVAFGAAPVVALVPLARLRPADWNPRLIRDARFKNLCASLQADPEFLWRRPILANTEGIVMAGNMRLRAAQHLGWTEVPAIVEDVPDLLAKERALRDNAQWGEWQDDDLSALVYDLKQAGSDLTLLGFEPVEVDRLLAAVGVGEGAPPPEPQLDRAEELREKWQTAPGQLWEIGRHRLLCGDSLDPVSLDSAVGDAVVGMVWADPPYGISIVATNVSVGGGEANGIPFGGRKAPRSGAFSGPPMGGRKGYVGGGAAHIAQTGMTYMESNKRRLGSANGAKPFGSEPVRGSVGASNVVPVGKYLPVRGDETTETACAAYRLMAARWPRAAHVWWGGNYYSDVLPASSCWLVWNKENGDNNFADCELAWTNQKTATRMFTHRWNGMLRDSERERRLHPTQKPAALAAWAFAKYTEAGAVIFDPFLGAGMSVVAAEQTGRCGIGIECEPGYVAVTLERLAGMGLEPRLVEPRLVEPAS